MNIDALEYLSSTQELEQAYGQPSARALVKELTYLNEEYQRYIRNAPFVLLATVAEQGIDVSPRGDAPGFVQVHDANTLLLADRKGNNRADSLKNLLTNPTCGLLFLIPGIGEALRVRGSARITLDSDLCQAMAWQGKPARSVMVMQVEKAYFQCQKAIARSGLWQVRARTERGDVPTAGDMIKACDPAFNAEDYDSNYPQYMNETLY